MGLNTLGCINGSLQISLPSFPSFPSFKLSKPWINTLYGNASTFNPVTATHLPRQHTPLRNLHVSLSTNGAVEYGDSEWKIRLAPVGYSLTSPTLYESDELQLLRGSEGETGLSFYKDSSRHFFVFGKIPSSKLLLSLEVQ